MSEKNTIKDRITNLINQITTWYLNKSSKKASRIQEHPVRYLVMTFSCASLIIILTIGLFILATPAFRNFAQYTVNRAMISPDQLKSLRDQIDGMQDKVAKTIVEQMNKVRNPKLDGIAVKTLPIPASQSVFTVISPADCSHLGFNSENEGTTSTTQYNEWVMGQITDWAMHQGYDSIIFGRSYVTAGGASLWTDGVNQQYDTDLEYLLKMVEKHDCHNTLAFIINLDDNRILPLPVTKSIKGRFIVKNMPLYKFHVFGYDLWDTKKTKTIFMADNFQAEVTNGESDFTVLVYPGESNEPTLVKAVEKKKVEGIREFVKKSLETVSEKL